MADGATLVGALTIADIANHLHVSKGLVRRLIRTGELGADPCGRVSEDDLRAFIDSCRETTSVYFVQMETSRHVKIGIALDVRKRLDSLRTGNPERLGVVATALMSAKRASKLERELHGALAEHRLVGEWFRAGPWLERLKGKAKPGQHFSESDVRRILL